MAKALSKGIVKPMGWLLHKLLFKSVSAIALYPFIFIKDKARFSEMSLLNHERIHLKQQVELLIIPFYLIYLLEYSFWRLKGRTHQDAYRAISFEKEAFNKQDDQDYLSNRKLFAMWRK